MLPTDMENDVNIKINGPFRQSYRYDDDVAWGWKRVAQLKSCRISLVGCVSAVFLGSTRRLSTTMNRRIMAKIEDEHTFDDKDLEDLHGA